MSYLKSMSPIERKQFMEIINDPVQWAYSFLRTFNPATKQIQPWKARWYQVEMMRDKSTRKVYRCGRRIGRVLPM